MNDNVYIYIFLMALVTFIIRLLPLTLIKKPIKNKFIKSFLYYVPYVTLTVMTFPAIIEATNNIWAGIISLIIGILASFIGINMVGCAAVCCTVVFLVSFFF